MNRAITESQVRSSLGDDLGLDQSTLQSSTSVVDGMQETQDFSTELPVLRNDSTAKQTDSVAVRPVKLLKTVQHE